MWAHNKLEHVMQPKDVQQYFHSAVTHLHTGRMDTDNVQHSHTQTITSWQNTLSFWIHPPVTIIF